MGGGRKKRCEENDAAEETYSGWNSMPPPRSAWGFHNNAAVMTGRATVEI